MCFSTTPEIAPANTCPSREPAKRCNTAENILEDYLDDQMDALPRFASCEL
jgi:hypothetical protein